MSEPFGRLVWFLRELERRKIHFEVASHRTDAVSVNVTPSPNERWEVDFFPDGAVHLERFRSEGVEADDPSLDALLCELDR